MPKDISGDQIEKAQFMSLVIMLSSAAMQQLGKIVNPLTGKAEVNLEAARSTIDVLLMLNAKTKGNLDADEDRLLKQTLSTLQLNYVETAEKAPAQAADTKQDAPGGRGEESKPSGQSSGTDGKPPKEPKYHKSY